MREAENTLLLSVGTGKTVTGTHLVYALAMKLRIDTQQSTTPTSGKNATEKCPCVMYCGPSQRSVDVALGKQQLE